MRSRHSTSHKSAEPKCQSHAYGVGCGREPGVGEDEGRDHLKQDRTEVLAEGGHAFILSFLFL